MNMIKVRQEEASDYPMVFELVKEAFEQAEHTNGDEQNLLRRLRKSAAFVPKLSLVAEENGEIVGQVMFTKAKVGKTIQLVLGPIAVKVGCQGKGIGAELIKTGHRIARDMGYEFVILVGYPTYYSRFGYVGAAEFGLKTSLDLPDGVFMAVNLQGRKTQMNAEVEFDKAFFES